MKYSALEYQLYGRLTLVLRGADVGTCMARLQQAGIPLTGVRVRAGQGSCSICLRDFDAVYRICRAHHVRFRIAARQGLPFWRKRLWRRKALAVGAILFVCIVYSLSSLVWRIDIVGPKDADGRAEIRDAAKAAGLYVGQTKAKLGDPVELQQKILAQTPNFVWIGVRTSGTVATIQALPKVEGTKSNKQTPHDVVADKPGVIRYVYASRGRVQVTKGRYVQPGDILISGNLHGGKKRVAAAGKVMAEVWYTSKVEVPLQVTQAALTGESVKRDYVYIGSLKLRVWGFQEPHFSASYERDAGTDWKIGRFVLPIQWQNVKIYAAKKTAVSRSVEEAKTTALQLAQNDVRTQMQGEDGRILGQSVLHQQLAHGTLYETVLTRVEEDIGAAATIPAPPKTADKTKVSASNAHQD